MSLLLKDLIKLIGSEMYHYSQSGRQKSGLFDRARQKIQALHDSPRTEKTYIGWIKCFIFFHGKRHPASHTPHSSLSKGHAAYISSTTQPVSRFSTALIPVSLLLFPS